MLLRDFATKKRSVKKMLYQGEEAFTVLLRRKLKSYKKEERRRLPRRFMFVSGNTLFR